MADHPSNRPRRPLRVWVRVRPRLGWLSALARWNRNQFVYIVLAILVTWLLGALALFLTERRVNPDFDDFREAIWNVWILLFAGIESVPRSSAGRLVAGILLAAGAALAGLFTASVASILVERFLRRRTVLKFERSDHLVICHWAPRASEWIRQVRGPITNEVRPIVIVHDRPEEIELPGTGDDPAFSDITIIKGDPISEAVLRRANVCQAHAVVIFNDARLGEHADGKTILTCVTINNLCSGGSRPNIAVECFDHRYSHHLRRAGADDVIIPDDLRLRLLARASLFPGISRVYRELLSVRPGANEMFNLPVPESLVGLDFIDAAGLFLRHREDERSCVLIGLVRDNAMILNPIGTESGNLREGDMLILLSRTLPEPNRPLPVISTEA